MSQGVPCNTRCSPLVSSLLSCLTSAAESSLVDHRFCVVDPRAFWQQATLKAAWNNRHRAEQRAQHSTWEDEKSKASALQCENLTVACAGQVGGL